ncbi:AsmA family protein [Roseateles sp. DAIF2]|uniref:AsmA family protein n=1 Tax=Roseateles sp. DAIF2 TaxID=2714952 RepID=UPI0018A2920A|nr:AsmA family protein [Roseateles sp. DAIF2]QPF75393.1 AsmA family protein [Roseateles sp. DAIF2]
MKPARLASVLLLGALLLGAGFAYGEWRGWPWLARPLAQQLSERLGREVLLRPGSINAADAAALRIGLWGAVRLQAGLLQIAGPAWQPDPPTLEAEGVELTLRYTDLWDWRGRGTLRLALLRARELRAELWRDAEGRASWQLDPAAPPTDPGQRPLLQFERLELDRGQVRLRDRPLQVDARIELAIDAQGLRAKAEGRYRDKPLQASLNSPTALPWIASGTAAVPLTLSLRAGRMALDFEGQLRELVGLQGLQGRYRLDGPSLAAIGDPLGVTLPSTAPFRAEGRLGHEGMRWSAEVERAALGRSRLEGSFVYDTAGARPLLSGRLGGASLWFADLGPTVGVPTGAPAKPPGGRVLPERRFDLPSLKAMDADVQLALQRIDLGAAFAEPIAPARGRLQLQSGVLTLSGLDLRTARGRLGGRITLDGRDERRALWSTELDWDGLSLERWLRQERGRGQPPYVSGQLAGRLQLSGQGRSTAELLASAQGRALAYLPQGRISHLAVEAAGIDLAQTLGVWLRGDDALPLQCAVADLRIRGGRVTPQVLVLDTRDSTLWADGSLSLADEKLALRLQVAPKDFSPLALRSPLRVEGPLSAPQLSLERGPLARRLVPAALLAALNPLAAVLPLIDAGDGAAEMQQACRALLPRA